MSCGKGLVQSSARVKSGLRKHGKHWGLVACTELQCVTNCCWFLGVRWVRVASEDRPIQLVQSPPGLKVWKPGAADAFSTQKTELRESLVTAVRVPRSHHLQKGDVRVDQCGLHSPESRDGVASRTSL